VLKRLEEERIQLIERERAVRAEADSARELDRPEIQVMRVISHELRTPLNSIIGFTRLTLDGPVN